MPAPKQNAWPSNLVMAPARQSYNLQCSWWPASQPIWSHEPKTEAGHNKFGEFTEGAYYLPAQWEEENCRSKLKQLF